MKFRGKDYDLIYNAAAHFAAQKKYGDESLSQAIGPNDDGGFNALCWALEELSTQGELIRRHMGYNESEPIKASEARLYLTPPDVLIAKQAVLTAISAGVSRQEVDKNEEVDLGLIELQKKTVSA